MKSSAPVHINFYMEILVLFKERWSERNMIEWSSDARLLSLQQRASKAEYRHQPE